MGLGQGVQKIFYLPEAHTDMILANIGEELGLVGITAVVAAYGLFGYAGLRIALHSQGSVREAPRKRADGAGLRAGRINIAAVLGVAPLTGIPLPFLSYGGSSLVVLLASVGILLNIAIVGTQKQLRCLIAAGGTAGHVLPALAVAEALTARGVQVTFAGSPDRVEARLVPEAGYEFDPFRISGFPRQPSPALARALLRAGAAPVACRRILRRRRPDVVLGGGGYVAGPMVLAAATLGIPAALTESDAQLGLANRLAAPFARRVFLAYPLAAANRRRYRVVGRPIPARSRAIPRSEAREIFELPRMFPCSSSSARGGRPRAQRARRRDVRAGRPGYPPHLRRA